MLPSSPTPKSSPNSLNVSGQIRSSLSLTLRRMRPVFARQQIQASAREAAESEGGERPLQYFPRISHSRLEMYEATKTDIRNHIYDMRNLANGVHVLPSGLRFYAKSVRLEEAAIHIALTNFALSENVGGIVLAYGYFLREGQEHSEEKEGGDDSEEGKYILLMEKHEGQVKDEKQKDKVLHALLWIHSHNYVHGDLKLGILNVFGFREENGDTVYIIGDFGQTIYTNSYIKKRDELIDFSKTGKKLLTLNPDKSIIINDDVYSFRTQSLVTAQLKIAERARQRASSEEQKVVQDRYIDHLHVLQEEIKIYFAIPEISERFYKELAARIFVEGLVGLAK